jgi:C-terminal processing protease CtpA/Prc
MSGTGRHTRTSSSHVRRSTTLATLTAALVWTVRLLADQPADDGFLADFAGLCDIIADEYAYFDQKTVDWQLVRETYRERVRDVGDDPARFLNVIETMLEELYDFHVTLSLRNARSPAMVPPATDLWAERRDDRAVITAVRPGSPAAVAGLRAGDTVVTVDGVPVSEAIGARLGSCGARGDPAAMDWALIAVLAGRGGAHRRVGVRRGDETFEVPVPPCERRAGGGPLVEQRRLPGGIGLIRLRDSLGDNATIAAFDEALGSLGDCAGLMLDLRDTPSGGNTTVARAIMGRLIAVEAPYQRHEAPWEERRFGVRRSWLELVTPRGAAPFLPPVVVLVDRWTASMGEGLAMGLDGLQRATVVGTPMAGLLGGTRGYTLERSHIVCRFPVDKLFHVDGTPRAEWRPPVLVDLVAAAADPAPHVDAADDPILQAGVRTLERLVDERAAVPTAPRD